MKLVLLASESRNSLLSLTFLAVLFWSRRDLQFIYDDEPRMFVKPMSLLLKVFAD